MTEHDDDNLAGDDNTYVGPGPFRSTGSRNTVWTAADAHGNVVIPGGTAVGYGARADATSVAVGSGASGGDLPQLLVLHPASSLSDRGVIRVF
jgi:hypothetical protein